MMFSFYPFVRPLGGCEIIRLSWMVLAMSPRTFDDRDLDTDEVGPVRWVLTKRMHVRFHYVDYMCNHIVYLYIIIYSQCQRIGCW